MLPKHFESKAEAIAEWDRITGQNSTTEGCPCCGQPHNFDAYDEEGKYIW